MNRHRPIHVEWGLAASGGILIGSWQRNMWSRSSPTSSVNWQAIVSLLVVGAAGFSAHRGRHLCAEALVSTGGATRTATGLVSDLRLGSLALIIIGTQLNWHDALMAPDGEARHAELSPAGDVGTETLLGESRWPPVAAVLVFMAFNVALRLGLPGEEAVRVPWLLPTIEGVLLVVLVTSDPSGRAERRRLRRVSLVLVGLLVAAALWATVLLVDDLIKGTGVSNSAGELLASGAVVWLGNNLAFALLYWLIDGGGPIARSRRATPVDFAFTQQMSPELAQPGWRPVFLDYLHLGFTNATAFSPTDVLPLTHRAKYAMLVQSTLALVLFGLVVARAVNAFT